MERPVQRFELEFRKVRHIRKFHDLRGYDYTIKVHKLEQQLPLDLAVQYVHNTITGMWKILSAIFKIL